MALPAAKFRRQPDLAGSSLLNLIDIIPGHWESENNSDTENLSAGINGHSHVISLCFDAYFNQNTLLFSYKRCTSSYNKLHTLKPCDHD